LSATWRSSRVSSAGKPHPCRPLQSADYTVMRNQRLIRHSSPSIARPWVKATKSSGAVLSWRGQAGGAYARLMMGRETEPTPGVVAQPLFATTHWSVVLAAANQESPAGSAALERLCRTYWYPIYVFIRRQGHGVADAQDLTQSFFAHILSRSFLKRASPAKGKFVPLFLGSLKYFCRRWANSRPKRGGAAHARVPGCPNRRAQYRLEPVDLMDAERPSNGVGRSRCWIVCWNGWKRSFQQRIEAGL